MERPRGVFLDAGGSKAQWEAFYPLLDGARTIEFEIQVSEDNWAQLQHHDGGPALDGWLASRSMEVNVVRAVELTHGNRWYDYQFALDGQSLAVAVHDADDGPQCDPADKFIHHAIFESAPFTRVE